MDVKAIPASVNAADLETENDRFKRSFGSWFWSSMITATVLHFLVFQFWPTQTAASVSYTPGELEIIELPPEIEIPPPPEEISRPATPQMATAEIDEDITMPRTTFDENPVADLPPPPMTDGPVDLSANPAFSPMTVRPEIRNRREVAAALRGAYPAILRDAEIEGTVVVWFFISKEGTVLDRRVAQSSGQVLFDEAALEVADIFEFSPALNRDQIVQVWIQLPIVFHVQ